MTKLRFAFALLFAGWLVPPASRAAAAPAHTAIDRRALVARHKVVLHEFDANNPLTVGNGEFAFTADATGLQTFSDVFTNTIPLGTLSQWGWHSSPNPDGWSNETFHFKEFDVFGRKVGYNDVPGNKQTPETRWLRANPHRLHLGQIGFLLTHADGKRTETNDLTDIEQTLDLWNGILHSRFKFDGQPVDVETVCGFKRDLLAVRVVSPLLKDGRVKIQLHFPYGTGATVTADWNHPDAHETLMNQGKEPEARFTRKLDADRYYVAARWSDNATLVRVDKHKYVVEVGKPGLLGGSKELEFVCEFLPKPLLQKIPSFGEAKAATREHWNKFWGTGGAIDLSGSKDSR